jgi:ParB-like chromosome segregation protein Spo0J
MQTLSVSIDSIEVGERHRALSAEAVARLAESMKEIGLRQPISIRVVDLMVIDGRECEGVPVLVTGHHRLAAANRLGWANIDCIEVDDDALKAELWEIAENLHRLDLTKEQRDEHIRRYAELLEMQTRIVPQSAEQMPRSKGRPISVTRKVANATGLSDDTVRRALNPQPRPAHPPREIDLIEQQVAALRRAWNNATPKARDYFLSEIGRLAA